MEIAYADLYRDLHFQDELRQARTVVDHFDAVAGMLRAPAVEGPP